MRTFSLGTGTDIVKFANAANANGVDEITGFTAGSGGDVLNVSAFLSSVATLQSVSSATSGTGDITVANGNVVVLSGDAASATKFDFKDTGKIVIVKDTSVYLYDASSSGEVNATNVLTTNNQVATLTGVDATTLVADNFIGIAAP